MSHCRHANPTEYIKHRVLHSFKKEARKRIFDRIPLPDSVSLHNIRIVDNTPMNPDKTLSPRIVVDISGKDAERFTEKWRSQVGHNTSKAPSIEKITCETFVISRYIY